MMEFKDVQGLECSKPVQRSLFYDSLSYLLPFRLGGVVKAAEEDHYFK